MKKLLWIVTMSVNPSEIKDLVTRAPGDGQSGGANGVNPSEIKDLVTLMRQFSILFLFVVSILQKSRTWLHLKNFLCAAMLMLCQSFRNQGPGYTQDATRRTPKPFLCQSFRNQGPGYTRCACCACDLSLLCQSFRNQGPGYTRKLLRLPTSAGSVSILQKSRTWLHKMNLAFRIVCLCVSILQKSRTWLHPLGGGQLRQRHTVSILQKSRTWLHADSPAPAAAKSCVNPSEIKDLVTPLFVWPGTPGTGSVNPSEIKDLVTHRVARDQCARCLCQSFRNQGPGYTVQGRDPLNPGALCQSFRNQGPGYTRLGDLPGHS